jgi:hypothetical protein
MFFNYIFDVQWIKNLIFLRAFIEIMFLLILKIHPETRYPDIPQYFEQENS